MSLARRLETGEPLNAIRVVSWAILSDSVKFCLTAIEGPLEGELVPLPDGEVTIGRDPGNQICVTDPAVSMFHCVVRSAGPGRFQIAGRESQGGTFVNGIPAGERILEQGDEIRIGNSVFLFQVTQEEPPTPGAVRFEEEVEIDANAIVRLGKEEAVHFTPEAVLASPAPSMRLARAFNTLLRISTAIHCSRDLDELVSKVLRLLFDVVPAEHGAVLLFERWTPEPVSVYCRDQVARADVEISIARTLVDRAYQEGVAVLSNQATHAPGPVPSSALAVPLFGRDKLLGVIYLDSRDPNVVFEQDHLQLATAVGVIAGAAIESARHVQWLRAENERLHAEIDLEHDMIGVSGRMREVYRFIAKVARTDSTVLICGESGTGKELVARSIHRNSLRAGKPFVAINCAALTESLLESELFGHERGAFTGAVVQKKGKLEVGDGGTVFLDEVGELPLGIQAKLLRALQEREFERVGGTHPVSVNIRLIAATNRELLSAVANGEFRQDLYYRLNVVSLKVPPLRERREDIPLLAGYFAAKHGKRSKRPVAGISPEACACLLGYDWPGNVRELENAVERAVVLGSTDLILPEDLPDTVLESGSAPSGAREDYHEAIRREKREQILKAMEQGRGNYTEAARILGLHPNYLHRLIRNLHLRDAVRKVARDRSTEASTS